MLLVLACVTEQHDLRLFLLAVLICVLACFTALSLLARAAELPAGRTRLAWLTGAATIFGAGVWTTHFVAMLAYRPNLPVGYDVGLTFASVVVAVVIGWLGLWFAAAAPRTAAAGGAVVGAAIGAMHYLGMAALRVPAVVQWDTGYVAASLALGILLSAAALGVTLRAARWPARAAGALLLVGAILGLHFTAMTAVTLVPDPTISLPDEVMAPSWLAIAVAAVTVTIIAVGVLARMVDRQLAERSAHVAELRRTIAELERSRAELRTLNDSWRELSEQHRIERPRAEMANRTKSEFLANMSHELRTPLNSILGFADVMRTELLGAIGSEQYRGYAHNIHESGSHLLTLINDLLDLAKVEAGKTELHEAPCNVADIAKASLRLMSQPAQKAAVQMRMEIDGGLPGLFGDEHKLRQILFNLLSNAIKFTPKGGRVTVRAGTDAEGGITLGVTDTGIGIPPDQLDRVLQPFTQVENIYSRTHAGTGLGLPLCHELARLHGGELRLTSEVGGGTTVTISFPAERSLPRASHLAVVAGA
jgi:signal transduction histidine kinase